MWFYAWVCFTNPPARMFARQYDFKWNVDAQDYDNYYGQQETANNGRVDGSYYVWMPDGRLMVVTYYVDGESGFVPTINYIDDYQPTWGTPYYQNKK